MTRNEFIKWLETETSFERMFLNDDSNWKYVINAEYIQDELEILEDNRINFFWEYIKFGKSEKMVNNYSMKEFIYAYKENVLKMV